MRKLLKPSHRNKESDTKTPRTRYFQSAGSFLKKASSQLVLKLAEKMRRNAMSSTGWIFCIVFSLTIVSLILVRYIFAVHTIKVDAIDDSVADEWITDELANKNMILLSDSEIKKTFQKQNPIAQVKKIEKQYPQTLVLQVVLKKPVAYVALAGSAFALLDEKGIVARLVYEKPEDLTRIDYYEEIAPESIQIGEYVGYSDVKETVALVDTANECGFTGLQFFIQDKHYIETTINGAKVLFANDGSGMTAQKLKRLCPLLESEGQKIKQIDLRFEKVIIEKI